MRHRATAPGAPEAEAGCSDAPGTERVERFGYDSLTKAFAGEERDAMAEEVAPDHARGGRRADEPDQPARARDESEASHHEPHGPPSETHADIAHDR